MKRNKLDTKTKILIRDKLFKNGPSKIFKGCLPQILLGPFLNTLSHVCISQIVMAVISKLKHFAFNTWSGVVSNFVHFSCKCVGTRMMERNRFILV